MTDDEWEDAGLRLTEAICAARRAQTDRRIATFFADPRFELIRDQVEAILGVSLAPIDAIIGRVRREVWRDYSKG